MNKKQEKDRTDIREVTYLNQKQSDKLTELTDKTNVKRATLIRNLLVDSMYRDDKKLLTDYENWLKSSGMDKADVTDEVKVGAFLGSKQI